MNSNTELTKLKYFLYARKSSEKKERQAASIEDQLKFMTDKAAQQGLVIVDIFQESKTSFVPGVRPIFREMISNIKRGKADGLLCWEFDRLSRNPQETGELQQLLQDGVIKAIVCSGKVFTQQDNALLLSVEGGTATEYSAKISKNARRGLEGKLRRGDWGAVAPPGYLNNKITKQSDPDPERFDLIRRMFDAFLTGLYSPPRLKELLSGWGYRSTKHNKISKSGIYSILKNPFYAGMMLWKGELLPGNQKQMVTPEEFQRVQQLLRKKEKTRYQTKQFSYSGLIRCGECGCMIVGEEKTKMIVSVGGLQSYTFYHCSKKRPDTMCSQKKYIREEQLERLIKEIIFETKLHPDFQNWALNVIQESQEPEIEKAKGTNTSLKKALTKAHIARGNLLDMRANGEISAEEFEDRKVKNLEEINRLETLTAKREDQPDVSSVFPDHELDFNILALQEFDACDMDTKKLLLSCLGIHHILKDRRLKILLFDWFLPHLDYCELEA